MQEKQEQPAYQVYVYVNGIKVRCRKAEKHSFKVGSFDITLDESGKVTNLEAIRGEAIAQAKALVNKMMKTRMSEPKITFNYVTYEKCDGYEVTKAMLFDDRNFNEALAMESVEA